MIDVESEIFSIIAPKVRGNFPGSFVTGEKVKSPPSFPCSSIVEADNQVYRNTRTSSSMENHAQLMYEVEVFSNKTTGKKSECRKIMAFIDSEFAALGFTRITMTPVPNEGDSSIYRLLARYRAIVSTDKKIYRR